MQKILSNTNVTLEPPLDDISTNILKEELNNVIDEKIDFLEQVEIFNVEYTKSVIENLKSKLSDELKENNILKKENSEKKIDNIEYFIENYSDEVSKQLVELQNIVPKLTETIKTNENLKDKRNELEILEDRKDVKKISRELQCIKRLQLKIKNFLEKN